MESNAFASLAILHLPSACRLLASACCPDKDLVVLISRLGGQDRMSLWKMQGSKTWEVEVGTDENASEQIVGLAWSPDGQSIAVAHDPPRITIHSVQDGHEERFLPVTVPFDSRKRSFHIIGVWWFREEKTASPSSIPDIFKRNDIITGTAHSILKTLPLLDNLQEDAQKLTATDLFAFQGSQTRSTPKSSLPDVIKGWPTLHSDPLAASMSPSLNSRTRVTVPGPMDEVDDFNVNSILAVTDDVGHIHSFLDGSYPLGAISLGSELSIPSLFKHPSLPTFFAHPQISVDNTTVTNLQPVTIVIPLLDQSQVRSFARLSSTARELVWYTIRVVKDMLAVWFGSETLSGARELGPKWIRALETKQQDQFGQEEPNSMLDLTCLLVTGRASDSLVDFLGSGEQMSERGIQKWESSVTEALVKIRDFSEKRVAPACQRLHLVLEEVKGWSQLPQYSLFGLQVEDINSCLDLAGRAIVIASWLAATARRELSRFKEFISWLRFETTSANPSNENNPSPRHDILEVNNYLMSGLVVSSIDRWFMGPVPQFSLRDLGEPGDSQAVSAVIEEARSVANDPAQMAWQLNVTQKDLKHLDRNLDALVQELAIRCQRVFVCAAGAASRSAMLSVDRDFVASQVASTRPAPQSNHLSIHERIIREENERDDFLQYLAIHMPSAHRTFLCLAQLRYGNEASKLPLHVGVTLLECCLPEEGQVERQVDLDLLEADFFDDECVVIVYRLRNKDGGSFIATVGYNDLGYQELQPEGYVTVPAREDLMLGAMERWRQGHLPSVRFPIKRCRGLVGCETGPVSLAVNGRVGRRVACVLDNRRTTMQSLDLEGDGEDTEGDAGDELDTDDGERS